jgi:murein L,D-transpeptidase YcbB/YkuD
MLGQAFNYTPGIQVGGINSAIPNKLAGMSTQAPRTAAQGMMNLPAYMRKRAGTGQQMQERETQNQDGYRAAMQSGKTTLGRQFGAANQEHELNSMQAANSAANQYHNTMLQGMQQQQQLAQNAAMAGMQQTQQFMAPMLGQAFSGGWW